MRSVGLGRKDSFHGELVAAGGRMSLVRWKRANHVRRRAVVAAVFCLFLGVSGACADHGENLLDGGGVEAEMPRRWLGSVAADERGLLLDFKSLIILDPSAALSSWTNFSASPCRWNGIVCYSQDSVIAINLSGCHLQGSISASLGQLPSLANLTLSTNNLSGAIPTALLRNASSLVSLDLSYNLLNGSIPSDISAPRLTTLNLYNNTLKGPIPVSLGNCSALVELSLYYNSLSSTIPVELGNLVNLQKLALSFNQLHGAIPTSIYTNCTNLILLALSGNALSGSLPPEIGRLSNLQSLWMDGNLLSGSIPEEIGNLTRVNFLRLSENNFTGTIPASLGQLVSITALLSLGLNQLTGPIPRELGNLTSLTIMTLVGNFLNGTIPTELGNLHGLQGLFLANNMLSGTIPGELSRCSHLQRLTLSSNRLVGAIPAALGSLQSLYELHLDRNMLEGRIPASFSNLTRLQDLSLGYNSLNGSLSAITASASTLVSGFSMAHNIFTGPIPPGVGEMIHVEKIDLSWNNLSGNIPKSLGYCVNLLELNLSFNSLTGTVPELGSLNLLQRLDLSGNAFSGSIPYSLSSLSQLEYVDLSFNNFSGQIPTAGVFVHLNASSFRSNPGLCGLPSTRACPIAGALSPSSAKIGLSGLSVAFKILIIISCLLPFAIFLLLLWYSCSAIKRINISQQDEISPMLYPGQNSYGNRLIKFTAQELEAATENFNDNKIIGIGSVSRVYRVTNLRIRVLPTVKKADVAIKRLRPDYRSSFSVELNTLGAVRHRNLVGIYGYCDEGDVQALILEFLANGSLQEYLHADDAPDMSLRMRLQIALGVAHGLAYLHHGLKKQIVHRDLKPSNILLDESMVPKVADFGLAKLLGPETLYSALTGTPGYIAPECGETLRVNSKGDVYSFGIVVLELLTRKQPTDEMFRKMELTMPNWVRAAYLHSYREILDPQLRQDSVESTGDEALRAILQVGLACVEIQPNRRPNMEMAVKKLDAIESLLSRAANPAISHSTV